jgi:hypothetical protein
VLCLIHTGHETGLSNNISFKVEKISTILDGFE